MGRTPQEESGLIELLVGDFITHSGSNAPPILLKETTFEGTLPRS